MNNNKHLFFVDSIRAYIIIGGVVLFHILCGLSFLTPKWYVYTPVQSKFADFYVVFIDTWAMAGMFFISGYFSWPSLMKKGSALFLQDRFNKVAVPSLVVLLLLCPTMPYFAQLSRGESVQLLAVYMEFFKSFLDFGVKQCSFNSVYCHHHLWFVELLLAFSLALVPLKMIGFGSKPAKQEDPVWKITVYLLLFGVLAAVTMGYSLTIVKYDAWFRVGPLLTIQASRVPLYVACFLLGILAERGRWLDGIKTLRKSAPWIISILVLIAINVGLVSVKSEITPMIQDGISRVMFSYFMIILLLALSARFLEKPNKIISELSDRSFNIYLLHLPVVVALQYWMMNIAMETWLKVSIIYVITVVVCMPNLAQRLTPSVAFFAKPTSAA